ncbi:MAG: hypothetical protein JSR56_03625 [Proteobacteria bacterium]|nr:hypothetical protein [Pseudomonadota bacterium]
MKRLSLCLAVILLGGLPLAAAALDYGPDRPLLAAENGAPQLPTARESVSAMQVTKPDLAEPEDTQEATTPQRMTPSAASPAPAPRGTGPSASNKPRASAPPKPAAQPDAATWRSLLPGSIQ